MDIELTPEKLPDGDLKRISEQASKGNGIDTGSAIKLIRHILWQDENVELVRVRLDHYLDTAHGNPALISLH
jgi:hypothetical protein